MSLSSIHTTFNRVLKFLVDELAPEVIKMPQTMADKATNAKEFDEVNIQFQSFTIQVYIENKFSYRFLAFQTYWDV